MATIVNEVVLNLMANVDKNLQSGIRKVSDSFNQANKQFSTLSQLAKDTRHPITQVEGALNQLGLTILKNGAIVDLNTQKLITNRSAVNKLGKAMHRFNMNTLTVLFSMMALQRATQSFLRSAITTYQKANDDTQGLGKATWELNAAWEFFKYSLIDALVNSAAFQMFIQFLLEIVKWLNKLPSEAKAIIIIAIIFLFVIATISMLIAIFYPLFALIAAMAGFFGISSFAIIGFILGIIIILVLVGIFIFALVKIVQNWGKDWVATIFWIIVAVLALAGIMIVLAIMTGAAIFITIALFLLVVAVVLIVVMLIIKHWNKIKIFFFELVKTLVKIWVEFVYAIIKFVVLIANAFIELQTFIPEIFITIFTFVLNLAIKFVTSLLSIFSKLPGIGALVDKALAGLKNLGTNITEGLSNGLETAKNNAKGLVGELANAAMGTTVGIAAGITDWANQGIANARASEANKAQQNIGTQNNTEIGTQENNFIMPEGIDFEEFYRRFTERQNEDLNRNIDSGNN